MKIAPLELADFNLVEVKTTNDCKPTPHCKVHGAMNKLTEFEGGGIWRCISVVARTKIVHGNSISYKEIDNVCRAGCIQIAKHS